MEQQPPLLLSFADFAEHGPAEVTDAGILVRFWFLRKKGYVEAPDALQTPLGTFHWLGKRDDGHLYVPAT